MKRKLMRRLILSGVLLSVLVGTAYAGMVRYRAEGCTMCCDFCWECPGGMCVKSLCTRVPFCGPIGG
jgi:hypothetical protein